MASIPARMVPVAVASAVIATLVFGCGARAPEGAWPLPNGDLAGTAVRGGIVDRRGKCGGPQSALAVPAHGEPELLGGLRVDAGRRPRDGLRPGPSQQRLRARPHHGNVALGTALPRAERRAQRPGRGGRPGLWRHGHGGVRTRCRDGAGAVAEDLTSRGEQFIDIAPGRVERTRLPEHHRVSAVRQRRDLRARRR